MRVVGAAALLLSACGGRDHDPPAVTAPVQASLDWRRVATPADRKRLREWRTAWMDSLADARRTPEGARAIAADPALFDPDHALGDPMPPAGDYRCRTTKLGRRGDAGLRYVGYGWFRCRIGADGPPVPFTKLDGSQRPSGAIYTDTDARAVLLGALALGDEARTMRYGRDRDRNVVGRVERIGEQRWRIAFPYPAFESTLDLMELEPQA